MAVTHILFDCDNTLALSEDIAFAACTALINETLAKHGVPSQYTPEELQRAFVGQNFRGILSSLRRMYSFSLSKAEEDALVATEVDRVTTLLEREAVPCEGCMEVLEGLAREGRYGLAVVSSSALPRVQACLKKTGQDKFFPPDHVFSAATSLPAPSCKPDPDIYIHTCKVIGKRPEECLAIEDSKSGTLSAVRAGIPVMGYVGSYPAERREEMEKTLKDTGAKVVMRHWSDFAECLKQF